MQPIKGFKWNMLKDFKTIETDHEIEEEDDSSLSPIVFDHILRTCQGFLTLELWMHHFLLVKTNKEMII